jgi:hypothetical protein
MTADDMREIERRRLRALVEADMPTAAELHADDYELITPLGVAVSKEQYLGAIGSGQLTYARFEPVSEIAVRLGAEFAVLRYQAAIFLSGGGTRPPSTYWHTDVYQLRDRGWQVICSQATLIPPHD